MFGAGFGCSITCLYFAFPALLLLIAHLQPRNANPQGHATALLLKGAAAIFLVPTAAGFLYGTVLMAVVAVTFERNPRLVRAATTGAAYGSVVTSLGELLLVTLSAVIRGYIREPADILIHWTLSLGAAAAGGLVGLLLGLVIGAMLVAANPD
jgi:hypothetical protein